MVPMNTPGITKAKKIRKIGMMSSDTGLIHFDDVRVPQTNRIGEEGMGFTYQMMQFQEERLWAAANAIEGAARAASALTADYTRERRIFGKSVLDHQVVHYRLAELKTEVEALRALVYMATEKYVAGGDVTEWASMAKLKAVPPAARGARRLHAVLGRHGLHLGQPGLAPLPRRPARLDRRRRRRGDARHHRQVHAHPAARGR